MNNKSFSNRLSWRIIGIVAVVFFISFIVIGLVSQYAIAYRADLSLPLVLGSNLVIVGVVALLILYFLCRKEIRRMTRPITELSVSALNMGKGNFKAQLPEITSKDEMLRLRNSFVYMQNSISDYISELKTTRNDNERMESELNVARTIQMGMLNTNFPPQLHALLIPAKEVGGDLYDFIRKGDLLHFAVGDVSGKGVPASLVMSITRAMSLLRLLMLFPLYRGGKHIGSRPGKNKVLYRQAREVTISSKDLIDIYIDGEQLPGSQFHLKILPGALPLRLPQLP